MEERDVYSGIVNTLIEKPKYKFTIQVNEQQRLSKWLLIDWFLRKVNKVPVETEREFTIYPCKVTNMHRVAGRAVMLPSELLDGDMSDVVLPLIVPYRNDLTYIIASAIQNNSKEPDPLLVKFIQANFDNIDIFKGFNAALDGLEMESFLNSIVLAKGTTTILKPKTNPMDGSELIASHKVISDLSASISDGNQVKS